MRMKHFTSLHDVPDPKALLNRALQLKQAAPSSLLRIGEHKTLVLLFFNPSLRTRLSTQKAGMALGMQVMVHNAGQGWQLEFEEAQVMDGDKAEHVREAAAVISQYADIIGIRTFPSLTDRERDYQDFVLQQFVRYASVPVLSLESAIRHPLQSLADWMTIVEHQAAHRPKVVLTWAPHPKVLPQAVANSFVEWMQAADVELVVTHPRGYELAPSFAQGVSVSHDQAAALAGADFVYAKNWSPYLSYGQPLPLSENWMLTAEKMALTRQGRFMHCLPMRRNVVAADAVIDHPRALHLQQANNRTYAAMAVLEALCQKSPNEKPGTPYPTE